MAFGNFWKEEQYSDRVMETRSVRKACGSIQLLSDKEAVVILFHTLACHDEIPLDSQTSRKGLDFETSEQFNILLMDAVRYRKPCQHHSHRGIGLRNEAGK